MDLNALKCTKSPLIFSSRNCHKRKIWTSICSVTPWEADGEGRPQPPPGSARLTHRTRWTGIRAVTPWDTGRGGPTTATSLVEGTAGQTHRRDPEPAGKAHTPDRNRLTQNSFPFSTRVPPLPIQYVSLATHSVGFTPTAEGTHHTTGWPCSTSLTLSPHVLLSVATWSPCALAFQLSPHSKGVPGDKSWPPAASTPPHPTPA